MASEILKTERDFFAEHIDEWLKQASGRFALIKGAELIGFYNTIEEALTEGARQFQHEPFLVRPIVANQTSPSIPALTLGILRANPASSA
jgi:hypothetical protein